MNKLWVYGASNCLPFNLENSEDCWAVLLSKKMQYDLQNQAKEACDNLYIYHKIMQDCDQYQPDDIVIVAWTHPNRKSFVYDSDNPEHVKQVETRCLFYPGDPDFFRSYNLQPNNGFGYMLDMLPRKSGNTFFDTWFKNYHSDYEQQLNLQAYIDSVYSRLQNKLYFFYLSEDSLKNIHLPLEQKEGIRYLEFVKENNVSISDLDLHCNEQGHQLLCGKIYQRINYQNSLHLSK